jgi:Flp pilus assembly CpaE family ATPase
VFNSQKTYQFRVNRQEESEVSGSAGSLSSSSSPSLDPQYPELNGADRLSIALIGPDEERRSAVGGAIAQCHGGEVREFSSYPPSLDDLPTLLEQHYDVIIIDLDSNPEYALELVESICARNTATVMVYSANCDPDMVVPCMRAGAREFLTPPFDQNTIVEALVRAAAIIRPATRPAKKTGGRMLVFLGAKGGSGVTTIASNYAIALALESGQSTLLIDLGLPMGDAALNLGIVAEYSTDDALHDVDRLDASLLAKLIVKHQSGVSVLAAPSKISEVKASKDSIDKLMAIARQEFDNVIVDVGSRLDLMGTAFFKEAFTVYLVTQAGISELRNSNRLISQYFSEGNPKLEIVINRFESSFLGVTEEQITKALTRPVQWKIPDDYDSTRQMQNTATPLSIADSPVSRIIRQMARSVCGLPATPEKKTGFRLRSLGRSIAERISTTEEPPSIFKATPEIARAAPAFTRVTPAITSATPTETAATSPNISAPPNNTEAAPTVTWSAPEPITYGTGLNFTQLNATASVPGKFEYTPGAGYELPPGVHTLWVTFTSTDNASAAKVQACVSITVSQGTPTITWPTPSIMYCGTPLGATQLNATASVPGRFEYSSALGDELAAGTHTLSVTFTPTNKTNYTTAKATVLVNIVKASPALAWSAPSPITYGTILTAIQLNATASVPGRFVYIPGVGAVLAAGTHRPSVIFTPTDTTNYATEHAAVSLTVAKAMPIIAWSTPASVMTGGTALSATQLNAAASVPGIFVYTPAACEVLAAGTHTLSVTFTPTDAANYTTAQATLSINVEDRAPVIITWSAPSVISYGTALSATELSATASVPGAFVYIPTEGNVLTAGRHTLSVTFTPADTAKYATAQATVTLMVEESIDVASLQSAVIQEALTPSDVTPYPGPADEKRDTILSGNAFNQNGMLETRTYKGAVYEKREDGQWHLQQK